MSNLKLDSYKRIEDAVNTINGIKPIGYTFDSHDDIMHSQLAMGRVRGSINILLDPEVIKLSKDITAEQYFDEVKDEIQRLQKALDDVTRRLASARETIGENSTKVTRCVCDIENNLRTLQVVYGD